MYSKASSSNRSKMWLHQMICLLVIFLSTSTAFQLTIVHTNDVHARFEEASASGGMCRASARTQGLCFGGVARRLTKIRELNATYAPNMILLDAGDQFQGTLWFQVFKDPQILSDLVVWKEEVLNVSRIPVGSSRVGLEGRSIICRLQECNIGNLITDYMIWGITEIEPPNGTWTTAAIALMNSGGIRASGDSGEVTMEEILSTLPFQDYIDVFMVKGRGLLKALGHAVAKYEPKLPRREFYKSQILYDLNKEPGKRLVDVKVRCHRCVYPQYSSVVDDQVYPIIMPTFTANGGDEFDFEIGPMDKLNLNNLDSDMLSTFIAKNSPVYASVEGRIRFCGEDKSIYCPIVSSSTHVQYGLWSLIAIFVSIYGL